MELLKFQIDASTQIADRFQAYMQDPLWVRAGKIVPFYQNLSSITGSGKTLMLADTVEQMRIRLPVEPIVLWLSKGKVVVWQTLTNLADGKYSELLGGYDVKPLLECKPADVENSSKGLVLVATVGKFNQKDKEEGDRKVFKVGFDDADKSLWDLLKARRDNKGIQRPFIIVYDEGHNLSNQQTELLLELEPQALIAASATMKIPEALTRTIERLKQDANWTDKDLVTAVPSSVVVKSGLVKQNIMLGGYVTPMEIAVNELMADFDSAEQAASELGLQIRPKAIYVSNTNTVDGTSIKDDMDRPFAERQARPILIWRHLVENLKVDPAEIAVYCDLKFNSKAPADPDMNLFSGGDVDYDRFITGNFRHIIFNLTLQEGWDDPECCFAYVDKEMGSPDQVTQVVGRVLRQPGGKHYPSALLNTANFYIRADEKGVFDAVLEDVKKQLVADIPDITLNVRKGVKGGSKPLRPPLKEKQVPTVSVNSAAAKPVIQDIVEHIVDYTGNTTNTVGKGGSIRVLQTIGTGSDSHEEWVDVEHSNKVTARWVFIRELQKRNRKAIGLCDIEHPKFDVLVEYYSTAADNVRAAAADVVTAYIEHSVIVQNALDPYIIGSILVDESDVTNFKNAVHAGYSGLNGFEAEFAEALDKTRKTWCRNPSQGAFGIDLLDRGTTKTFNPDFLVWTDKFVVAIDTKGDHLITEDAARKLFFIEKVEPGIELTIRLVTKGKWHTSAGQYSKESGSTGYTVWMRKQGKITPTHCPNLTSTVQVCLQDLVQQ